MQNNYYNITTTNTQTFGNEDGYIDEDGNLFCKNIKCTDISGNDIQSRELYSSNNNRADINGGVGNNFCVGGDVSIGNNISVGGTIFTNDITTRSLSVFNKCILNKIRYHNKNVGFLYINQMSIPLVYSIYNTTISYGGLDLKSFLGNTGNNSKCLLHPESRLLFLGDNNQILFDFTNTYQTSILYTNINFIVNGNCNQILIFSNDNLITD